MRWLALLLISGLVATCGQKGPLTLPEEAFHISFSPLFGEFVDMRTRRSRMEQIPMATGEFACGASLSALGPVMLPNAGLLNELNVPKGKPRTRTLFQFPGIVPRTSSSRCAGLGTFMEQIPMATG